MYPAGVADVSARSVTLHSGLRLRLAETGPGTGAPVLLVHGWGACVYTYRYLLPELARTGRRAIAFDLRGHGLSEKPHGTEHYTAAALMADLVGLLDVLGVERADMIGHSLGGRVLLQLALAYPSRIGSLVLAAPVGLAHVRLRRAARLLTPRITDRFARHLTPRWLTSFLLHGAYGDPRRAPNEAVDEYWAPSQFPGYYRALRALLEAFSWNPLSDNELGDIDHRTLVILGTADRLIPDAGRRAGKLPNGSVLSIEGAGHLGVEECAKETNAAVIRFLGAEKL